MFPDIKINEYSRRIKDEETKIHMYIDFDKYEKILYNNIYFTGCKNVLKMPIYEKRKNCNFTESKVEKFDLSNYVYFIDY